MRVELTRTCRLVDDRRSLGLDQRLYVWRQVEQDVPPIVPANDKKNFQSSQSD
jgi:hypothetical protein